MAKGILYFAQNPAFQHLTKIGKTTKEDVRDRKLSGSNVPEDFEYLALLDCEDVDWAEKKVHLQFKDFNHTTKTNRSTEFFWSGCIESAIKYAKDLKGVFDQTEKNKIKIQEEVKEEEILADVLDTDSKEERDVKLQNRPRFDFTQMGLEIGSYLILKRDKTKRVKIENKYEVSFNGEIIPFSALTAKLVGAKPLRVSPMRDYWETEDGRKLMDIYNETYPKVC